MSSPPYTPSQVLDEVSRLRKMAQALEVMVHSGQVPSKTTLYDIGVLGRRLHDLPATTWMETQAIFEKKTETEETAIRNIAKKIAHDLNDLFRSTNFEKKESLKSRIRENYSFLKQRCGNSHTNAQHCVSCSFASMGMDGDNDPDVKMDKLRQIIDMPALSQKR